MWVLIGLHGCCLLAVCYQRCSFGIHCHVDFYGGGKQLVNYDGERHGSGRARTAFGYMLCCCFWPLVRRLPPFRKKRRTASGALTYKKTPCANAATMTEVKGLYLYARRRAMQDDFTLNDQPKRLDFLTQDASLASSYELTPLARAPEAEHAIDNLHPSSDVPPASLVEATTLSGFAERIDMQQQLHPSAHWGFSSEAAMQTEPFVDLTHCSVAVGPSLWAEKDVSLQLTPLLVDAAYAHSDECFAYYHNYPAIGSAFSGPWRCTGRSFYNGVPVQIEFEHAESEWEPQGYAPSLLTRPRYHKVPLVALIEERARAPPAMKLGIDDGGGSVGYLRVCYVASYVADDDTLTVSRGYSSDDGGHCREMWKLDRVGKRDKEASNPFRGSWRCGRGSFYGGTVVEIEPDGHNHRWFPRGATLANYTKLDLVDLVEMSADAGHFEALSGDDGGTLSCAHGEKHHVCTLSSTQGMLTVSTGYDDNGHAGETWTLERIGDCAGLPLTEQVSSRTYKYIYASQFSQAACDDASGALGRLNTVEFDCASEAATKSSPLGIRQGWSVEHLDASKRRENREVLDRVALILRRSPELVCEVHGMTTTPQSCDPDLARHFGLELEGNLAAVMDALARERAAACLEALVGRGVERGRLRVTYKGSSGESCVHFIARAQFATRYDMQNEVDAIFGRFDADESGDIDASELRQCLNHLGLRTDTDEASRILAKFDDDESGRLEFQEFKRLVGDLRTFQNTREGPGDSEGVGAAPAQAAPPALPPPSRPAELPAPPRFEFSRPARPPLEPLQPAAPKAPAVPTAPPPPLKAAASTVGTGETVGAVFRRYDRDGSGDIDVNELREALPALGLPVDSAEAARVLAKYDQDHNKRLDKQEFRQLVKDLKRFQEHASTGDGAPQPPPLPAAIVSTSGTGETVGAVFRRFDADGSGSIDLGELRAALPALGLPVDTAAAADVLAKYDRDGDGRLDKQEFRQLVKDLKQFRGGST
jgi:Ca2+-binding EF-hand superfamily protein